MMLDWVIEYWLQVGFGLLVTGVGVGFKMIANSLKKDKHEQMALRAGVVALLHDRLYQACMSYIEIDHISASELNNLELLYNAYHTLGGNGTGTELYERAKNLTIQKER